jgi:enoyl-CoA hydratase
MTTQSVNYSLQDGIATIQIDDGKRNALSPGVLREIYAAFDRAEADNAIVIITGRDDVFSAGFDLKVMKRGGSEALKMLWLGYSLPARVLNYPRPVIAACNGHVLAMGVFLMLSADYVIGSRGDFRIAANEVAIGMKMPRIAAAMLRHRLEPAACQRAVTLAEYFDVDAAKTAGFFDDLVEPGELIVRAQAMAEHATSMDRRAHKLSKRGIRASLTRRLRTGALLDMIDAALLGLSRARGKSGG